ncbi:hypothetical protein JF544_07465 [Halobacillus kuroshimensis]|uniref:Uncharacterized protein n=1 Tax=Halobacillus kuroshimensis TaxID=302481 RepID=A0ABS3DUQ2_9BACI|nr:MULTISPECIES: hypothetical protein [Halobacillus]MBN8235084.1 hypothetical protein [Halobacillus kuroshimensis]
MVRWRRIALSDAEEAGITDADDGWLPKYEKDSPPSSKGELGEGESFSILMNTQGAVPLPLLRKNE